MAKTKVVIAHLLIDLDISFALPTTCFQTFLHNDIQINFGIGNYIPHTI